MANMNNIEKEKVVLSYLRKNARKSVAGIASESGITSASVMSIQKRLENSIIKKYVSLLDFQKLGYNVSINIALKLGGTIADKDRLVSFLQSHRNVNSIFRVGADYDYYAETIFSDIKGLYDFLDELSAFNIQKLDEHHIIEELKKEEFLSVHEPSSVIEYPKHMMFF
jgi:DNA-binding Lrp family transcriptional regulator